MESNHKFKNLFQNSIIKPPLFNGFPLNRSKTPLKNCNAPHKFGEHYNIVLQ